MNRATSTPGLRDRLVAVPVLRSALVRRPVQLAKLVRRRAHEQLGSDRYSRPSLGRVEAQLAHYLPHRDGVFVEAGAYDGYWQSNTYWLERFRGWSGVLVEPIPELAGRARRARKHSQVFQCALVPAEFEQTSVQMIYGGTMSMVRGAWGDAAEEQARAQQGSRDQTRELQVPARTLSDVLDAAAVRQVDFLSLDVEGYEASVLRGLDLSRHAPGALLVEMAEPTRNRPEIERILGDRFRYEAQLSSWDHLYLRIDSASDG